MFKTELYIYIVEKVVSKKKTITYELKRVILLNISQEIIDNWKCRNIWFWDCQLLCKWQSQPHHYYYFHWRKFEKYVFGSRQTKCLSSDLLYLVTEETIVNVYSEVLLIVSNLCEILHSLLILSNNISFCI
jgi:hypothetical protein